MVLSEAKNRFFLILIHIEITSFLLFVIECSNIKDLSAFFMQKMVENKNPSARIKLPHKIQMQKGEFYLSCTIIITFIRVKNQEF